MRFYLRFWCSLIVVLFTFFASRRAEAAVPDIPDPEGAVTDRAGVLASGDDEALERRIAAFRGRTHYEVGVLILPTLVDSTIEDVAHAAFHQWGVGQKGADNGVLLVIATKERRTRIETGRGIGDRLTDLACARILEDDLRPHLRAGHFRAGIEAALGSIEHNLDSTYAPPREPATATTARRDDPSDTAIAIMLIVLGVAVFALCALARPRRYAGLSGYAGSSSATSAGYDGGASSWSSGGGGFDAGGGGGFGGGDSGGGGASGGY